jgi:hypothetical protein
MHPLTANDFLTKGIVALFEEFGKNSISSTYDTNWFYTKENQNINNSGYPVEKNEGGGLYKDWIGYNHTVSATTRTTSTTKTTVTTKTTTKTTRTSKTTATTRTTSTTKTTKTTKTTSTKTTSTTNTTSTTKAPSQRLFKITFVNDLPSTLTQYVSMVLWMNLQGIEKTGSALMHSGEDYYFESVFNTSRTYFDPVHFYICGGFSGDMRSYQPIPTVYVNINSTRYLTKKLTSDVLLWDGGVSLIDQITVVDLQLSLSGDVYVEVGVKIE